MKKTRNIKLIIDGDYLFHLTVHSKSGNLFYLKERMNAFVQSYQNHTDVYFVADGKKTWRKENYSDYKAKRKLKGDIDWVFAKGKYEEFKESFRNSFPDYFFQNDKLEGDDWLYFITKTLNAKGLSCAVFTRDKDCNILLENSLNPRYINFRICVSNKGEIHLKKGYEVLFEDLKKRKISDKEDFLKQELNFFINDFDSVNEVDTEESYFTKLIMGDKGDNIPSVWKSIPKTEGVTPRGIGEETALKLYKEFKQIYTYDIDFKDSFFLDELSKFILEKKGVTKENVRKNLDFNLKMTLLDKSMYDKEIIKEVASYCRKIYDLQN